MGGVAKGLLVAPDGQPIVQRTWRLIEDVGAECILVGARPAYREAYRALGLPIIADDPLAEGPLGGLLALLTEAKGRPVIAIACDMPFVERDLVRRLLADEPDAPILAPRRRAFE